MRIRLKLAIYFWTLPQGILSLLQARNYGKIEIMQALADYVWSELRSANYCPVYEEQLVALWPITDNDREAKIRSFAEEQGFRLRFYCKGQCAVFDKQRSLRV